MVVLGLSNERCRRRTRATVAYPLQPRRNVVRQKRERLFPVEAITIACTC